METKEIIYLVIYLIGFIWSYIILKKDRIENCWTAVMLTIGLSSLSWLVVIIYYFEKIKLPKPPKWL